MAVIWAHEVVKTRQGANDAAQGATRERDFQVHTDDPRDGPETIFTSGVIGLVPGLPNLGDLYQDANGTITLDCFCNRMDCIPDSEDLFTWIVRAYYTSDVTASPLNAPAQFSWSTEKYQKPIYQDLSPPPPPAENTGPKAVTTSSSEMFDPPVTIDDSRLTLTIVQNELTFNQAQVTLYQDAVNSDNFAGFDPLKAKIDSITGELQFAGAARFWRKTYTIHFRREGWRLKLFDMGYRELVNNKPRPILDPTTNYAVSTPYPLDGHGRMKAIDPNSPILGQLVQLEFIVYKELPFAALNLPLPPP